MHYCGRKGIWFIYDILSLAINTVCTIAGGRESGSYMTYSDVAINTVCTIVGGRESGSYMTYSV